MLRLCFLTGSQVGSSKTKYKSLPPKQNVIFNNYATVFDASTKIPTGVWAGNFFDLGNFDECYGLENETPNGTVYGKYCLGTVPVPFDIDINSFGDKQPNRFSSVVIEQIFCQSLFLKNSVPVQKRSSPRPKVVSSSLFGWVPLGTVYTQWVYN